MIADTALDVISRCRVTSISSKVSGRAGGCSGAGAAELIAKTELSYLYFILLIRSSHAMILPEERQTIQMVGGSEDHLYWLKPLRVIIWARPIPNLQGVAGQLPSLTSVIVTKQQLNCVRILLLHAWGALGLLSVLSICACPIQALQLPLLALQLQFPGLFVRYQAKAPLQPPKEPSSTPEKINKGNTYIRQESGWLICIIHSRHFFQPTFTSHTVFSCPPHLS